MGSRTIRLDEETERALVDVTGVTGMTASQALRKGLFMLRDALTLKARPYEIYRSLDLGQGGEAVAPACLAKTAIADALRRKVRR